MVLRTREITQVQFREVSTTGVFMAETKADHKNSMNLLKQNGFRALTYQEMLVKLDQNPELKERLKGRWFYIKGKGSALSGYYTLSEKGELTKGEGDIEKSVYVWNGSQPLSLHVNADYDAPLVGWRFGLDACFGPEVVAQVVVGVRIGHDEYRKSKQFDLQVRRLE